MVALHIRMATSESEYQQHKGDDQSRGALIALKLGGPANPRRCHHPQPCLQGGKNCGLYLFPPELTFSLVSCRLCFHSDNLSL